jgi:hypothetical protein
VVVPNSIKKQLVHILQTEVNTGEKDHSKFQSCLAIKTRTCAIDLATLGLKFVLAAQVFVIVRVEICALHHQRAAVDDLLHMQNEIALLWGSLEPAVLRRPRRSQAA